MTNILLTGSTGFVGKQIAKALSSMNFSTINVCRPGSEIALQNISNIKKIISSNDIFQEDEFWWEKNCKDVDIVIHNAWYMDDDHKESIKNIECLKGSLNLAKGAAKAGVKRFVGIGTCFEYDLTKKVLSVDTPLKPSTNYGAAKAALYIFLSKWLHEQSIEFSWCRLFALYGEGESKKRLTAYIHKQLKKGENAELTSGKQIRDFMNVVEAGKIIADIAIGNKIGPVNVCTEIPMTVRQFAENIAKRYNRLDLLKFGTRSDNPVDPECILGIKNY